MSEVRRDKGANEIVRPPDIIGWSGGKDCMLALHMTLQTTATQQVVLLTTLTRGVNRISMHGVRRSLLKRQAQSLGLQLHEVWIPPDATNECYEAAMHEAFEQYAGDAASRIVFGDIFLEDVRAYREALVARAGITPNFPLWRSDPAALAKHFLELGFKARVACVDTEQIDASFAGRTYDASFLSDLPPGADPCGERGEFHTFVYDGPLFSQAVSHRVGEIVLRDDRFAFCDLLPEGTALQGEQNSLQSS